MITYVIPTKDRPDRLAATLDALGSLPKHAGEVVVADNASSPAVSAPTALANGLNVRVLRLGRNIGAAARNEAVRAADSSCDWVVMLDDDSHPMAVPSCVEGGGLAALLGGQPADVAAVAGEIYLPAKRCREAGGLPEVIIGCGAAIRRSAFLDAGGYDPSFDYYAEEYDLCARLLLAGGRVVFDRRFKIDHHKVEAGRDFNRIVHRLVRNNAWVAQRYAPEPERSPTVRGAVTRYGEIASKENARWGYARGVDELGRTLFDQPRREMPLKLWDRFTGLAEARRSLQEAWRKRRFETAAVVEAGKGAEFVRRAIVELGVRVVDEPAEAEAMVIGTLSPGPLLDAFDRLLRSVQPGARIISPWLGLVDPTPRRVSVA